MSDYFEILATVTGLVQGLLIMFNKRSNWIAYVLQMAFLVIFSLENCLYGDVVNNAIYFILGIIGFIKWKNNDSFVPKFCTAKERICYISVLILGTLALFSILVNTNDPLPLLDSFTTISSLVATYYMINKKIDTWIIWFVNDIFYAIEYFILPDQAIYLFWLNVLWAVMAVGSYINWCKIKKEKTINKLYCAGTFGFDFLNNDYKDKAKYDYRSILLGDVEKLLQKYDYVQLKSNLVYIGPFYFESEGMVDETIVKTEIQMIKSCTHVIFLLDSGCCPGTIAELILATDLKKNVEIFYIKRNDDEETESSLHSPCWFAIIMSKINNSKTRVTSCDSYEDATQKIIQYVRNFHE